MFQDARDSRRLTVGVLSASAGAWLVLIVAPERTCHCFTQASGATLRAMFAAQSLPSATYAWLLMLVAMMAPMTLPSLRWIRATSFASRRFVSSLLFLAGYAGVWTVSGLVLQALELSVKWAAPESPAPALAIGLIAFVWQASPIKQKCLNRCHGHRPLAAFGVAAARDALFMGVSHGYWCTGSCWAMMLFPMLLPEGHQIAMAGVTLVMLCERLDPPANPVWRLRGFATVVRWLKLRCFGPPGAQRIVGAGAGP